MVASRPDFDVVHNIEFSTDASGTFWYLKNLDDPLRYANRMPRWKVRNGRLEACWSFLYIACRLDTIGITWGEGATRITYASLDIRLYLCEGLENPFFHSLFNGLQNPSNCLHVLEVQHWRSFSLQRPVSLTHEPVPFHHWSILATKLKVLARRCKKELVQNQWSGWLGYYPVM